MDSWLSYESKTILFEWVFHRMSSSPILNELSTDIRWRWPQKLCGVRFIKMVFLANSRLFISNILLCYIFISIDDRMIRYWYVFHLLSITVSWNYLKWICHIWHDGAIEDFSDGSFIGCKVYQKILNSIQKQNQYCVIKKN